MRIDFDGNLIDGDWPVPLGIPLHLELHKARQDIKVAMHNHPMYGTAWADMGAVPPPYDQSSGGAVVLVDEYDGGVNNVEAARSAVSAMGEADLALLAGHGVFVLGCSVRAVHQRAVALEHRCKMAWHARAAGGPMDSALPQAWIDVSKMSDGNGFIGFWEAMVRVELRAEPTLLEKSFSFSGGGVSASFG
jgi:L-ribulose-5-phosphate 4-epimerase